MLVSRLKLDKLCHERVHELFYLENGLLKWKVQQGCAMADSVAGTPNRHQLYVFVDTQRVRLDLCIWLYVHGYYPRGRIRHIDKDPTNCKPTNLYDDGVPAPVANTRPGISYLKVKQRFQVDVKVNGVKMRIGTYDTIEEANKGYDDAQVIIAKGGVPDKKPRVATHKKSKVQ